MFYTEMGQPKAPDLWDMGSSPQEEVADMDNQPGSSSSIDKIDKLSKNTGSTQTDFPSAEELEEEGRITFIGTHGEVLDITGDLNYATQNSTMHGKGCWSV